MAIKILISRNTIILMLIMLFYPIPAFADAGLPMFSLSFPIMSATLIPVIFIETTIFKKIINSSYKKALISNGAANFISTVCGFPLAWGLLFAIELLTTGGRCGPGFDTIGNSIITVIVEAAWLCPHENQLYWLVPAAFIISLIVAFFISLVIEYVVNRIFYKGYKKADIKKAVLFINFVSYGLLILLSIFYFIGSVITGS